MPLFISLMRLTQRGLDSLKESPARRETSERRVAALGGRSISFHATLGPYDFVQLFEMPDSASMLQYALLARQDGFVDPIILPAFDSTNYDAIVTGAIAQLSQET
ncbi:GYD domain-containing protein [Roseovarius arcticus]|uniref:GYD domain-containing protein n=1 Tax=Roseovarius arcticus TaxID=2547404 RepID=UPI0011108851|nr:GYD domain-containing protein [Roseovarius arcticus]